jgi:outer membrane protein assembly factor BamB
MDRRIRAATALIGAVLVLSTLSAGAAHSAPRPTLTLTPDNGPPTATFQAGLTRLPANSAIIIHWDEIEIGRGSADSRGALIIILNVPQTATPGIHTVSAMFAAGGEVSRKTFTVHTDWLQFHADPARSGANAFENVLSPATVGGIIINWRLATGGAVDGSAVVCDGHVVVGSADGKLYGGGVGGFTDPWLFQTRGPIVGTPVALPPGPCLVAVGSQDGTVYAVDAATGKQKWKASGRSPISSPLLIYGFDPQPDPPGKIIVGDDSGAVRALDQRGRTLWSTQVEGSVVGAAAWQSVPINPMAGGPSILQLDPGSRIFIATDIGNVYGLDPATGAVLIAIRLGSEIAAPPAVTVGQQGPPIPDAPIVLVGTADGVLHGLFADNLSEDWAFRTGGPITTTPAVEDPDEIGDPHLFVASGDSNLYGLANVAGDVTPAWAAPIGVPLNSSPAVANGVLYFGADDSQLRALDSASGRLLFASGAITSTRSSPIVVDGQVIVGTSHGELIGFYLPL